VRRGRRRAWRRETAATKLCETRNTRIAEAARGDVTERLGFLGKTSSRKFRVYFFCRHPHASPDDSETRGAAADVGSDDRACGIDTERVVSKMQTPRALLRDA
jgi:hypothetical protein